MQPVIRFVTAADGTRLAWTEHGEGRPLVFVRGWTSHLELLWADPAFRAFFEPLARHFRLVRFDNRGNGLSDREVADVGLDALVSDLEAVMDGLGLRDVVLYGATYGGPIAATYAARHPDRVWRLVLDGTYGRGADVAPEETRRQVLGLVELSKAQPGAAFAALDYFTNPAGAGSRGWYVERARKSISPEVAVQLYAMSFELDVTQALASLRMPTLVLHRRGSRVVPFELGRQLAALVPDATFVALDGVAHNTWEERPSQALAALSRFLDVPPVTPGPGAPGEGRPMVVLVTDMVDSTAWTTRLGDRRAQELVRAHNSVVRAALATWGGTEVRHTGDGILASFPAVSPALRCAVEVQRRLADLRRHEEDPLPLQVRIGLNAGEPLPEEGDLHGTVVQLACRVCETARPDEVLASNVVRELAAGKGFAFRRREDVALKGFEEPVVLYAVDWGEG
jgi:pimeloyl-ACP methyl ester carboxylesterase